MKQLFEREQMSVKNKCKNKISHLQNGRCESLRLSWEFSRLLESQGIYLKTAATGSSVQLLSHVQLFSALWTAACQTSLSVINSWWCCSNSCSSNQWCHPTISSSVVPFSSHLQSFPASGSFPMSQFVISGGKSIGVSASASVLPMIFRTDFL